MKTIYSVGQVNKYIRGMFRQDILLSNIFVRGEVSNVKYHTSGHIYFSLKDQAGTISCIMFAGSRGGLAFKMKNGDKVVCGGNIDVYEKGGSYQLYAREIRLEGAGLLYQKFMELKRELEEMGMFDGRYKQPIPRYARRIGVVTAPTGAAIRDIQNISLRRNPYVEICLYPAKVQGEGAADSIVRGIRTLDDYGVDLLIVGRGGGSMEDLWAFNEEKVARAIFECAAPVISAVGHETDTTIADYVADLRAPTPSAAAEIAVFDYAKFVSDLSIYRNAMEKSLTRKSEKLRAETERYRILLADRPGKLLSAARADLRFYESHLSARSPANIINEKRKYLADTQAHMEEKVHLRLKESGELLDHFKETLSRKERDILQNRKMRFDVLIGRFQGLNPLDRLRQGYSYVTNESGANVKKVDDASVGERLRIIVSDGDIYAEVLDRDSL